MGEYEPHDSRDVTLTDNLAPGEPPRTGPREDEAREKALKDEERDERKEREERDGPQHQAEPRYERGTMMEPPQQKGIQMDNLRSQSQSQSQGGQSQDQSQGQPAEGLDGDGARQAGEQAGDAREGSASAPAQAGETETDTASDNRPAEDFAPEPGSRETGVAQAGKEDLVSEGSAGREALSRQDRGQPEQYETNSPQNMPHDGSGDDQRRRDQARLQERQEVERDERGYGGLGQARSEAQDEGL